MVLLLKLAFVTKRHGESLKRSRRSDTIMLTSEIMKPSMSDQAIDLIAGGLNELKGLWQDAPLRSVILAGRSLNLSLPTDAIVHLRPQKNGLIVLSASEKRVLKLFFHPTFNQLLATETQTLLGFEKHPELKTSHYIKHGITTTQGQWLLSTYCPNEVSFKLEENPTAAICRVLEKQIYPLITPFYHQAGHRKITLESWLLSAHERSLNHPSKSKVQTLIDTIKSDRQFDPQMKLVQSMIHADLNENNILRDHQGMAVIDWENRIEGLVLLDAFDLYARHLQKLTIEKRLLFMALKWGRTFSPSYNSFFTGFAKWQSQEFECEIKSATKRLHFLIYIVERILVIQQTMKVDRFYRQGLEWRVWNAIKR